MSCFNDFNKCFICSKIHKIMISLQDVLTEYEELSVVEVLENLHFLTISDETNRQRLLCLICVAKIQFCFDFKMQCGLIENVLQINTENIYCKPSITPIVNPTMDIKQENNLEVYYEEDTTDENQAEYTQIISDENQAEFDINIFVKSELLNTETVTTQARDCSFENTSFIEIESTENKINVEVNNDIYLEDKFLPIESDSDSSANQKTDRIVVCPICHMKIKYAILSDHIENHSIASKPHKCNTCDKTFDFASRLRSHESSHIKKRKIDKSMLSKIITDTGPTQGKDRVVTCPICHMQIKYIYLNEHVKYHSKSMKSHKCKLCDKSYPFASKLRAHELSHTKHQKLNCSVSNDKSGNDIYSEEIMTKKRSNFICLCCDNTFVCKTELTNHIQSHLTQ